MDMMDLHVPFLRRTDNQKWYAVLLRLPASKIKSQAEGMCEILDLRTDPDKIETLTDNKTYFPGYHMNKKHWFTVRLDDSVPDQTLFRLLEQSRTLAVK